MTEQKQPEALRLAQFCRAIARGLQVRPYIEDLNAAAALLERQNTEIESLQDDLAHKDQFAEQLGRELAKADSEAKELRAKLNELEKQEPSYLLYPNGRCGLPDRPPLDAGHADATVLKLYLAAGARPVEPAPVQVTKPSICTDCSNADSWGLPDKPCCRSCVSGNNWQSLNTSSVNPNGPAQPAPAAEPIDEYQRGRRAGITEFYDSLYAIDKDRALAALHKIEPQPAPAAQADEKDAAQLYPVVIDGLLWLCAKHGGTSKPVDDCGAVNPPLSWKNALAASKKEPT